MSHDPPPPRILVQMVACYPVSAAAHLTTSIKFCKNHNIKLKTFRLDDRKNVNKGSNW